MSVDRKLKHWGWGYEDQQRPHEEVVAAAEGIIPMLGRFDPTDATAFLRKFRIAANQCPAEAASCRFRMTQMRERMKRRVD